MTTKANEKVKKLYDAEIRSVDDEKKTIRFRVSDATKDRYGESVKQDWQLGNFKKNPIGIWNHRGGDKIEPEDVLAKWDDFETVGEETFATAQFDTENPKAMFVFGQYVRKFLRTVSVGFIPHSLSFDDDTPVLEDNELLEISFVPIPANPNAISLGVKSGEIHKSDAEYMLRSMQEASVALEAELKAADAGDDDKDARITELEAQLAEANQRNDELTTENEELKSAADHQDDPDDSAKGGDNDQPGAEDDIDLDAELSDEDIDSLEVNEDTETTE